jgi:hypothetical protein
VFGGGNIFGGLLLSSRYAGHELSGQSSYSESTLSYRRTNWGVQAEVGTKVYLSNKSFFTATVSYELGAINFFHPVPQVSKYTRAFCFTLSVPFLQTTKPSVL